ncbi:MAG: sigma-54-dependent transcriptional regulator [Fidelibacterota bacterium]
MPEATKSANSLKILVVDDEELFRVSLCDDLNAGDFETFGVGTAEAARKAIQHNRFDVVLTDLRLPGTNGVELLNWVRKNKPEITVIIMTAYATVQTAVNALKRGAYDYITKPFSMEELFLTLRRIQQYQQVVQENIQLKHQLKYQVQYENLVGKCKAMEDIFHLIDVVSNSESSVLISGETGSGKEMIANAIHYHSPRANGPYIKVSCAIISKELLESELFGHVKGAFTGAIRDKKGRFAEANGGTLFLDDVDDIPLDLQVKLLRVLEEHSFEKVGGSKKIKVDIRVIAATKTDLLQLSKAGKFRQDLFYRLNVVPINVPPLRERKEDIPLLVEHFLKIFSKEKRVTFTPEALKMLINYRWPGNVRELKNMVERLLLVNDNPVIDEMMLPNEVLNISPVQPVSYDKYSLSRILEKMELDILKSTLKRMNGNQTKTARLLHIPLSTLRSKLQKYNII